jgi:hypothetical protein
MRPFGNGRRREGEKEAITILRPASFRKSIDGELAAVRCASAECRSVVRKHQRFVIRTRDRGMKTHEHI